MSAWNLSILRRPSARRLAVTGGVALTAMACAVATVAWGGATAAAGPHATEQALPEAALTVAVAQPEKRILPRKVPAAGNVAAREELVIGSDLNGIRLREVRVDVGASVRRGDLLAVGDDAQMQAQRLALAAAVRQAEAERSQAVSRRERAEQVRDAGVFSIEAVQERRTAEALASARLDAAVAQARELDVRLAQVQVRAPANGTIVHRGATVGSVVQPGTELFRMIRDDELEWRAELPDTLLAQVTPGQQVRVRLAGERTVEGQVRRVAPTVDPRTRQGLVHVSLPRGTPLRAGSHVQGELLLGQVEVWTLPETALTSRDGMVVVHVVDKEGRVQATPVQTGIRYDGQVEVMGLPPDARVVTTGAGFVKNGEHVRIAGAAHGGRS